MHKKLKRSWYTNTPYTCLITLYILCDFIFKYKFITLQIDNNVGIIPGNDRFSFNKLAGKYE